MEGYLKMLEGPQVEYINLIELKNHLRIEIDEDDDLLNSLIKSSHITVAEFLRRSIIKTKWELTLDFYKKEITLLKPPIISVEEVKVIKDDGTEEIINPDSYFLDGRTLFFEKFNILPDGIRDKRGLKIIYYAGYGELAEDVPENIKRATMNFIGHLYENREGQSEFGAFNIPYNAKVVLDMYKVYRLL